MSLALVHLVEYQPRLEKVVLVCDGSGVFLFFVQCGIVLLSYFGLGFYEK